MSLIVVHLRWDDVDAGQYEQLCRILSEGPQQPAGRLHGRHQRHGSAVSATEVWIDEQRAGAFLSTLHEILGRAGLRDPQRAVFAVPDFFAVGYGVVPARARTSTAPEPVLPTPRVPDEAPLPTASADHTSVAAGT